MKTKNEKDKIVDALKNSNFNEYINILKNILPRYIYKYCSHTTSNIDLIINKKIKLSHPQEFNDPFDSLSHDLNPAKKDQMFFINIAIKKIIYYSNDEIVGKLRNKIIEANILSDALSYNDKASILKKEISELEKEKHPLQLQKLNEIKMSFTRFFGLANAFIRENFISQSGLSCFSEACNNVLMWSHYGNYCSGLCIEYKTDKIIQAINNEEYLFLPVIYQERMYPDYYDPISEDSLKVLWNLPQFMYKNTQWEYEKEWRLVRPSNFTNEIHFQDINRIFLGSSFTIFNKYDYQNNADKQKQKYFDLIDFCSNNAIEIINLKPQKFNYGFDQY
jgi:Protein of unknown function (DUF2971).